MSITCSCLIAITISAGEVALGKVRSSGDLVGTTHLILGRQHIVGKLEVIDDLLEELVVSELVVAYLLVSHLLGHCLIDPRNLVEQGEELPVEMSTQETHLAFTLTCKVAA